MDVFVAVSTLGLMVMRYIAGWEAVLVLHAMS